MTAKRVEGKVALITGAAQGIGKATAQLLAKEGAHVVVSDIDDVQGKAVAAEIGGDSIYLHLDVQEENEWEDVMKRIVKHYGKLNILVNNAGITGFQKQQDLHDPENASLDNWRKVHAVNSDGVFLGCKWGIQVMKDFKQGTIINISSRSGLVGIPAAAAYAASKAAVINHTRTVALYCCQQGYDIRCNSVCPAAILTPMWEPTLGTGPEREKRMREIVKEIPMHKMGTPEDVAYAVLFLASEDSKYITGTELVIDGGILAGSSASPKRAEE